MEKKPFAKFVTDKRVVIGRKAYARVSIQCWLNPAWTIDETIDFLAEEMFKENLFNALAGVIDRDGFGINLVRLAKFPALSDIYFLRFKDDEIRYAFSGKPLRKFNGSVSALSKFLTSETFCFQFGC